MVRMFAGLRHKLVLERKAVEKETTIIAIGIIVKLNELYNRFKTNVSLDIIYTKSLVCIPYRIAQLVICLSTSFIFKLQKLIKLLTSKRCIYFILQEPLNLATSKVNGIILLIDIYIKKI